MTSTPLVGLRLDSLALRTNCTYRVDSLPVVGVACEGSKPLGVVQDLVLLGVITASSVGDLGVLRLTFLNHHDRFDLFLLACLPIAIGLLSEPATFEQRAQFVADTTQALASSTLEGACHRSGRCR